MIADRMKNPMDTTMGMTSSKPRFISSYILIL